MFTVLADTHLQRILAFHIDDGYELMDLVTQHIADDAPDFHIDLGDTFSSELYQGRNVLDFKETVQRHLDQRPFLGRICHSAPFFIALGNHEGELGWLRDGTPDNIAVWATTARKLIYPLPTPDDFYTGNTQLEDFVGLRENYYAWEWGDALFVILDPYWYTTTQAARRRHRARQRRQLGLDPRRTAVPLVLRHPRQQPTPPSSSSSPTRSPAA